MCIHIYALNFETLLHLYLQYFPLSFHLLVANKLVCFIFAFKFLVAFLFPPHPSLSLSLSLSLNIYIYTSLYYMLKYNQIEITKTVYSFIIIFSFVTVATLLGLFRETILLVYTKMFISSK